MKTKIVYVLVSSPDDCFYEQLLMSLYSLRLYNKGAFVELVVNQETAETLLEFRQSYKSYVSKTTIVNTPLEFNQLQKSRFLKTHLRNVIEGDFLYIDIDTIICDSLEDIDNLDGDICATTNGNSELLIRDCEDFAWVLKKSKIMGFDFVGREYYNAGINFVRDNERTRKFYSEWYECYKECVAKGVQMDQVSFCEVNYRFGKIISHMPEYWNCQIQRRGLLLFDKIKILHYYTNDNPARFLLAESTVHKRIKREEKIPEDIKLLISNPVLAFEKGKNVIVGENFEFVNSFAIRFLKRHECVYKLLNRFFAIVK